jgi:dTDP-4-dehydrorhamnose 3,5-epimerase
MKQIPTKIEGLILLELDTYKDPRGYFEEMYQTERYKEFGIETNFVQVSHSRSSRNVLRGLHSQVNPAQAKLIMVTRGMVLDVAVDVRPDSPTFGEHQTFEISDENHHQLYIPEGFLHGFVVLSAVADFVYFMNGRYNKEGEFGVAWNDPTLQVKWDIDAPIISERDQKNPAFNSIDWKKISWK